MTFRLTARRVTVLLTAVLVFYLVVVAQRGWILLRDGRLEFVLLGLGVLLLPLVGVWVVLAELRFGRATERLARRLSDEGGLPVDELPRRESGRIDRDAADEVFARRRAEVEAAPEDWQAWYRLAVAYGDAGDTSRGRRTMRHAIALHGAGQVE